METGEKSSTDPQKAFGKSVRERQRSAAINLALAVVLFLSASAVIVFAHDILSAFREERCCLEDYEKNKLQAQFEQGVAVLRIASAGALVAGFGFLTFLYASGYSLPRFSIKKGQLENEDLPTLIEAVETIQDIAGRLERNRVLTDEDRSELAGALGVELRASLTEEFLAALNAKYAVDIRQEAMTQLIADHRKRTEKRLIAFQVDISRKAAVALAWGLATAVIGLITLIIFILFNVNSGDQTFFGSAFHYAARMSLVVIIEVVAFFFLRHFRTTQLDEKYINNELTNAEFKYLALLVAIGSKTEAVTGKILEEFSKTERNFALKKGEVSIFHSASGEELLPTSAIVSLVGQLLPKMKAPEKTE
jgi:ABC-type uncharacterized transport system fused permease/ATPase subunit